jgi:3-hydroxyisobutyrate dehydrogenase-like beta-hydroxyacid dehydrogenase
MHEETVCGFIGLGSQGAPIARRIIDAGYPMILWARRAPTLDPFRETPAQPVTSIAELGHRVEYVGICVVGDDGVSDVCNELIPAMREGSTIAIHSTILPTTCRSLAESAGANGISLVDAPVSGGQPAAEAGKLTLMLGGKPADIQRIRPILQTFADMIVHLGDVGAGQKAKLINNSLMVANMGLLHSAVSAGVAEGLDRDELLGLLGSGSAQSFALDVYARNPQLRESDRIQTLIEKIELLGNVLGRDHATYKLLREAVTPLE